MITINPTNFARCLAYIENPNNGIPSIYLDENFGSGFFAFMRTRIAEHNMVEVVQAWYDGHSTLNGFDESIAQLCVEIELLEEFEVNFNNKTQFPNLYTAMPRSTFQRMSTLKINLENTINTVKKAKEEYINRFFA